MKTMGSLVKLKIANKYELCQPLYPLQAVERTLAILERLSKSPFAPPLLEMPKRVRGPPAAPGDEACLVLGELQEAQMIQQANYDGEREKLI